MKRSMDCTCVRDLLLEDIYELSHLGINDSWKFVFKGNYSWKIHICYLSLEWRTMKVWFKGNFGRYISLAWSLTHEFGLKGNYFLKIHMSYLSLAWRTNERLVYKETVVGKLRNRKWIHTIYTVLYLLLCCIFTWI